MTVLGVAFTGVVAGVSAGLSVLCSPPGSRPPARRLAFLATATQSDAARAAPRSRPSSQALFERRSQPLEHRAPEQAAPAKLGGPRMRRRRRSAGRMPGRRRRSAARRRSDRATVCDRRAGSARSASRPRPRRSTASRKWRTCSASAATRSAPGAWSRPNPGAPGRRSHRPGRPVRRPTGCRDPCLRNGSAQGTPRREHRRRTPSRGARRRTAGRLLPARLRPDRDHPDRPGPGPPPALTGRKNHAKHPGGGCAATTACPLSSTPSARSPPVPSR